MKRTVLFLGRFFPEGLIRTVSTDSKSTIGFSNHNFETMLIEGLALQDNLECCCITLPGVFSFPMYNNKLFTPREKYMTVDDISIVSPQFCNLVGINRYSKIFHLTAAITDYFRSCDSNCIDVIVNTPKEELLTSLFKAGRKTGKKMKTVLIVPDIPQMITSMSNITGIKKIIVERNNNTCIRLANQCDGLVLLTESMKDFFSPGIPHIVMEGLVNIKSYDEKLYDEQSKPYVLYTGTLNRAFGIIELIDAFEKIEGKNNVNLVICGSGPDSEFVKRKAGENSRIKYLGLVDRSEALYLQRHATVLVNPRTAKGEYTKYSFPSKTMEYLLSGRPVICNPLPGIPGEYYSFVYCPSNESSDALAECLNLVLGKPSAELDERGRQGRKFVLDNKNSRKQVRRILDFISSL